MDTANDNLLRVGVIEANERVLESLKAVLAPDQIECVAVWRSAHEALDQLSEAGVEVLLINATLFSRLVCQADSASKNVELERTCPACGPLPESISSKLTRRESDVVQLICRGHSNKEIASDLGVAYSTVKNHITSVLEKLGLDHRTQIALLGQRDPVLISH